MTNLTTPLPSALLNFTNATGNGTAILGPKPSDALFLGVCSWTTSDVLCYATMLPIACSILLLIIVLIVFCARTPQSKVLEELIAPSKSLLLPESFKSLSVKDLNSVLSGVNDVPLKSFLPRHDLGYLVEPCAALGVASIRDMLSVNPLGLRDIGIGPAEIRIFTRALERKVKLREAMNEAFAIRTTTVSEKARQSRLQKKKELRNETAALF